MCLYLPLDRGTDGIALVTGLQFRIPTINQPEPEQVTATLLLSCRIPTDSATPIVASIHGDILGILYTTVDGYWAVWLASLSTAHGHTVNMDLPRQVSLLLGLVLARVTHDLLRMASN